VRFRMRRPSPALVIACVALSVALGGTGYAVTRISGSQLVNRSVAGVKVKRDALGKAEIKEASIASASTPMDSRSGPLTAPFQAKFKTRGGPIVIVASGSGYRGSSGQVGMEVLVDGLVRGVARAFTNETGSHKAFVTSGIPVTGLGAATHTVSLQPLVTTTTDANDFFTVTVFEQAVAVGADRYEADDVQAARHGGACQPVFDTRTSGGATIAPAGNSDWWWSEWSWVTAGEIEIKVVGPATMDVYLWNTTTRLARNVKTFRKSSVSEWYDLRVHGSKAGSYVLTCRLISPPPRAAGGADARAHAVGEACDLALEARPIGEVGRERRLVADRLHLAPGFDGTLVAVPCERVEVPAVRVPERRDDRLLRQAREVAHGPHAQRGEAAPRRRTDAPEALDRQGMEKVELGAGRDNDETVGLGVLARELGEQLRGRDADRGREPGVGAHAPPDRDRAVGPGPVEPRRPAHVEERLVGRDGLDERRERAEDPHHLAALLAVAVEAWREEHTLGASAPRPRHRQCRVHAESARLVARGGDDTARAEASDDHRTAADGGIVELLHRRVERVEVDVQDRRRAGHPVDVRTTRRSSRVVPSTS